MSLASSSAIPHFSIENKALLISIAVGSFSPEFKSFLGVSDVKASSSCLTSTFVIFSYVKLAAKTSEVLKMSAEFFSTI